MLVPGARVVGSSRASHCTGSDSPRAATMSARSSRTRCASPSRTASISTPPPIPKAAASSAQWSGAPGRGARGQVPAPPWIDSWSRSTSVRPGPLSSMRIVPSRGSTRTRTTAVVPGATASSACSTYAQTTDSARVKCAAIARTACPAAAGVLPCVYISEPSYATGLLEIPIPVRCANLAPLGPRRRRRTAAAP